MKNKIKRKRGKKRNPILEVAIKARTCTYSRAKLTPHSSWDDRDIPKSTIFPPSISTTPPLADISLGRGSCKNKPLSVVKMAHCSETIHWRVWTRIFFERTTIGIFPNGNSITRYDGDPPFSQHKRRGRGPPQSFSLFSLLAPPTKRRIL